MTGIHKYRKRLANGSCRWYYKVSREKGAPVFWQADQRPEPEPFSEAFQEAYAKAKRVWQDQKRGISTPGTINALIDDFHAQKVREGRSRDTISNYERSYPIIREEFGPDAVSVFTNPGMRKQTKEWHRKFEKTPRQADYHLGTLVAMLNFAVDEGDIAGHVIGNIKRLHDVDRSDIIFTPDEFAACIGRIPEMASLGIQYGAHTGIRLGDCVRMPVTACQAGEIVWATSKSGGKQDYCVPITDRLQVVLDRLDWHRKKLEAAPTTTLFNSRGKPWTPRGLSRHLSKACKDLGIEKSFHDLRGTAATNYALAGFSNEDIAEFLGWKVDTVKQIIKRYVGRDALVQRRVVQLNANAKSTNL